MSSRYRTGPLIIILSLALIPAFFGALLSGSGGLSPEALWQVWQFLQTGEGDGTEALILFELRLPRIILAMAVGASLGVSGAAFQGIFRNSLADPYVIGASSGAALGAALAITAGLSLTGPVSPVALCAFGGALIAVFLAFVISRSAGNPPPTTALLLAGVSLSSLFSALLSLILVLKDQALHQVYYWLLGSLNGASWTELPAILPVMFIGCLMVFLNHGPLDLLLQGEEVAESLGTDVRKTRLFIVLGASLAAAAAVSAAGIIGFVGLIAPHAMRMITGPTHKKLLPVTALGGALLVLLADILARNLGGSMEIPIGIITSLGGAPFFIYLLAYRGRRLGRF
ncbi:MAG: iron ABC transporter permease [Treponema sp.]|jgi:iron complex transport system permease protein|nr:iron ABC transporter permease [Treponema sp.]